MGVLNFAKNLFKDRPKRRWFGPVPDIKLEVKLNHQLPENIPEESDFFLLDFKLLKMLIKEDLVSTKYREAYDSIIYKDQHAQRVSQISPLDQQLIDEALKGNKLKEVMKLAIITDDKKRLESSIKEGHENYISNIGELYSWFHQEIIRAENQGLKVKKLEISHVHPSIEVLIYSQTKSTTITNGLSKTDIQTGKVLKDRFKIPIIISAILPSGLKYSSVF